ncbi:MAG TPA: amino acid permease [Chlamydiales bacterium]|nr:amino acid permease [Chlamydiales bacterium]
MKRGTLKRVLGVFDLFAIGYGDLGSSIFYALGVTALFALGATPLAMTLAGIVFICTVLSFLEVISIYRDSEGSASFARHAFGDLVSFIVGWGLLLDYIVTIAISAFAVGPYLSYFFSDLKHTHVQIVFSITLIFLLCVLNVLGVKESTRVSLVLAIFTLLFQAAIIGIGLSTVLDIPWMIDHMRIGIPNVDWSPTWYEFAKGVTMAMVAYTGIESIAQLSAESRDPAKTISKAILLTMVVVVLTYVGITLVAFSAVPVKDLGTIFLNNPMAAIVHALPFGQAIFSPIVAILAAMILTVAANAGLIGASRLTFNLGEHYQLPHFFYWMHPRFRTPAFALITFSLFAAFIVIASKGQLGFIFDLYNFGAMIAFFSVHISLIVLRIKKPNLKRSFRVPLNISWGKISIPLPAVFGAVTTLAVWCLVVIMKPDSRYLGMAWVICGIGIYLLYRKKQHLPAVEAVEIEKIHIQGFQSHPIHRVLLSIQSPKKMVMIQTACELAKMHNAHLTLMQVIEISPALPIDVNVEDQFAQAEAHLKKMEAIAREVGVDKIDLVIERSRSLTETLLEYSKVGKYDLLILENSRAAETLRQAPCRVILCGS